MGIKDLLPQLKSITKECNIKDFCGKSIAIDGCSWLYKASYTCSRELALFGSVTPAYWNFLNKYLSLLREAGITRALFVFDGCECPSKRQENIRRKEKKKHHLVMAQQFEASGDMIKAYSYFNRAVSISFDIKREFMQLIFSQGMTAIVAPYEADAQLAYFAINNIVDVVISEDSDLLVYGCPLVLYKLDSLGFGDLIRHEDIPQSSQLSFKSWSTFQFTVFCCLLGCDYCPRIPYIGVKTIHTIVSASSDFDAIEHQIKRQCCIKRLIYNFEDIANSLKNAILVFKHHIIYNPFKKRTEPLNPFEAENDILEGIVGKLLPEEDISQLLYGNIDPSHFNISESIDQYKHEVIENHTNYTKSTVDCNSNELNQVQNDPFDWKLDSGTLSARNRDQSTNNPHNSISLLKKQHHISNQNITGLISYSEKFKSPCLSRNFKPLRQKNQKLYKVKLSILEFERREQLPYDKNEETDPDGMFGCYY